MLFIVSGLMVFSSCKKNDPIIKENKSKLIGTWNVTKIVDMGCDNPVDNDTQIFGCETVNGVETCSILTLTFAADGTYAYSSSTTENGTVVGTEEAAGTWEIKNASKMTLCLEGDCNTKTTYTLTDNSFTTTGTDPEFGCTSTMTATKQ